MVSNEAKFAIGLFALIVFSVLMTPFWHQFIFYKESSIAVSIERFDAISSDKVCFDLLLKPTAFLAEKTTPITAKIKDKIVFTGDQNTYQNPETFTGCFSSTILGEGDNLVDLMVGQNRVFFHTQKGTTNLIPKLSIDKIEGKNLFYSITDANNLGQPIIISLNGKEIKKIFLSQKNQMLEEKIDFVKGDNNISISYAGISVQNAFNYSPPFEVPWIIGLILLVLMIFVLAVFPFGKFELIEKLGLSLTFTAVLLIANGFFLNYANFLNLNSFIGLFILEIVFFVSAFWSNKSFNHEKINLKELHGLEWIAIIILIFVMLFFHLMSTNHLTYWNGFYERNSNLISESFSIPAIDPLSYLGKPLAFAQGYFLFDAGLQWLTSLHDTQLFALILIFSDLLFFLSVLYLTKALGFVREKRVLAFVFAWFSLFILTAATLSPRHALSFAMFLLALGYFVQKKNPLITGIILGVTGFIQTPLLFAFPLFYLFIAKEIDFWKMLKAFIAGLIVFGIFYLPTFLLHGVPWEIEAQNWGYLINLPLLNTFLDIAPLVIFFVLFFVLNLATKKIELDGYAKKLGIVVLLGLIIQIFITYRWNILTAMSLALFIAYAIPDKLLKERQSTHLLAILMLLTAGSLTYTMGAYAIPSFAIDPFLYMQSHSSNSDIVLTDPLFGHGLAYISEKKVVADLAVEFADANKLKDSYDFVKFGNPEILSKYSVDWVFNQNDVVNENVAANYPTHKPLEFEYLNKLYSNGYYYVHKVWRTDID